MWKKHEERTHHPNEWRNTHLAVEEDDGRDALTMGVQRASPSEAYHGGGPEEGPVPGARPGGAADPHQRRQFLQECGMRRRNANENSAQFGAVPGCV